MLVCSACAALCLAVSAGCGVGRAADASQQESDAEPSHISASSVIEPKPEKPLSEADKQALRAVELLASMTLEEKSGQMFLAHYTGENSIHLQEKNQYGGYILFSADFDAISKPDMIERLKSIQDASKIKMLIGVDEEGGGINRVSINPAYRESPFKSPRQLYANGGFDAIAADTAEKSDLLKSIGINFNLAPVCDVSTNPADYIFYRTLGQDADLTSVYAETVVKVMNQKKIASTLKHFPGYGSNRDTHTGSAYDSRSLESLMENDVLPFIAGIKAGADCVLVSHNIVAAIDDKTPASLSPAVHKLLRDEIGFGSVIMTDDLNMGAIADFSKGTSPAVAAILAGNDLICSGIAETELEAVIHAIKSGIISEKQIDESVLRILRWKLKMGIIE